MQFQTHENRLLSFLALFASFGTLLCCALPSFLVLLGLGATVASLLSAAPWLIALSHQKALVFGVAGALIAGNFLYVYRLAPRLKATAIAGEACPADGPGACDTASKVSRVVLWVSAAIYLLGFVTAFVVGPLLLKFG